MPPQQYESYTPKPHASHPLLLFFLSLVYRLVYLDFFLFRQRVGAQTQLSVRLVHKYYVKV